MRNKQHQIDIDVMYEPISQQLAGSFGKNSHKELIVRVWLMAQRIEYIVMNHRKEYLVTENIYEAIEAYNSLP